MALNPRSSDVKGLRSIPNGEVKKMQKGVSKVKYHPASEADIRTVTRIQIYFIPLT